VPGIGQNSERLGSGSKIEIRVAQVDARGAIKLSTAVLAEIDVKHHLFPRSLATGWRREWKVLGRVGKMCERISAEKSHDATLSFGPLDQRVCRHLELRSNLPIRTLGK
jgi:hypothetical protein